MKRRRIISLLTGLAVGITMCFAGTGFAFAGTADDGMIESQAMASNLKGAAAEANNLISPTSDIPTLSFKTVYKLNTSKFNLNVPSTGYLTLTLQGMSGSDTITIYAKTKGFSDYASFSSTRNVRWIGVKKGTYTFTVDQSYADYYYVKAVFTKAKEGKYGKKKGSAANLKKGTVRKALMITGAQKVHWYKFKNTSVHKVKVIFKTKLSNTGNYLGGLKISFYKGGKCYGSKIIYDDIGAYTLKPYNLLSQKLSKGTYHVKVESYKKGTGFFTIKWK